MPSARITVVMPVYNGRQYLRQAIESILSQAYRDFELLIIDDGSTDDSREICRSYGDARIRLEENGRNLGLVATLNRGLDLAAGEYIARMDCDDVSLPDRFSRQIEFLEKHPEIGICGTWFERLQEGGSVMMRFPTDHNALRFFMLVDNPFPHSTIFMRRSVINGFGLRFDPGYIHAEDYELWARAAEYTKVANIPEILLKYRYHPDNISHRFKASQGATGDRVRQRQLEYLGLPATEGERRLHNALAKFDFGSIDARPESAKIWLDKLVGMGCGRLGIPEDAVLAHLSRYWYGVCGRFAHDGLSTWRLFRSSAVGRAAGREWQGKLLLRCLLRKDIADSPSEPQRCR